MNSVISDIYYHSLSVDPPYNTTSDYYIAVKQQGEVEKKLREFLTMDGLAVLEEYKNQQSQVVDAYGFYYFHTGLGLAVQFLLEGLNR